MRPPRFRLRTLVVGVALLALVLSLLHWSRQRATYRQEAEYHNLTARQYSFTARYIDPREPRLNPDDAVGGLMDGISVWPDGRVRRFDGTWIDAEEGRIRLAEHYAGEADRHARLSRAYAKAARYPWFAVPSDRSPHPMLWPVWW